MLAKKMDIIEAINVVQGFTSSSLKNRIAKLEFALSSQKLDEIVTHLNSEYIDGEANGVKSLFLTLACRFDINPFNGEAPPNPI